MDDIEIRVPSPGLEFLNLQDPAQQNWPKAMMKKEVSKQPGKLEKE
jgi:hypothetical protein